MMMLCDSDRIRFCLLKFLAMDIGKIHTLGMIDVLTEGVHLILYLILSLAVGPVLRFFKRGDNYGPTKAHNLDNA